MASRNPEEEEAKLVSDPRIMETLGQAFSPWHSLASPKCEALDASTGNVLWINSTSAAVVSSLSIDNSRVFFGEDDGNVLVVNETNGHGIWATTVGGGAMVRSGTFLGDY